MVGGCVFLGCRTWHMNDRVWLSMLGSIQVVSSGVGGTHLEAVVLVGGQAGQCMSGEW